MLDESARAGAPRSAAISWRSASRGCAARARSRRRVGLSATVASPTNCAASGAAAAGGAALAELVTARPARSREVAILATGRAPAMGRPTARHALAEIYAAIKRTRRRSSSSIRAARPRCVFQELWRINDDSLPIALHHGSLDAEQRRKVEAAMAAGKLRAVVCTSTLDLGIDWGDVDLVIHVGAPKGASRLLQRIGRANHRLDEPSRASSCRPTASKCWNAAPRSTRVAATSAQDTPPPRTGALDVLAQHILGMACAAPFDADALYAEVRAPRPTRAGARRFRRGARFRRDRRLCAEGLRALRQDPAGQGRPLAHRASARRAALSHECRHHRRGRHAEGAAGALARRRRGSRAAAGCSARSRNISSRRWRRATPSSSPARSCASRHRRRRGLGLARRPRPSRKCRPMPAASFRSRPISPRACAAARRPEGWHGLPDAGAEWLALQQ